MSMFKNFGTRSTFGFDRIFAINKTLSSKKTTFCHDENDRASLISKKDKDKDKFVKKSEKARDKIPIEDKKVAKKNKKRKQYSRNGGIQEMPSKRARSDTLNSSLSKKMKKEKSVSMDVFSELF